MGKLNVQRLPGNPRDEQQLCGGAVLFPGDIDKVAKIVQPHEFFDHYLGEVYAAILALHERGELCEALTSRDLDLLDIEVPTVAYDLTYYAKRIAASARKRRLIEAANEIAELGLDFHGSTDELQALAQQRLAAAAR
jgi:replicative DNA helicase